MTTSSAMKCCDGNCVRRWPLTSFAIRTHLYLYDKGKGVCVRNVCAIYDNNISPSLLMIIIKIIILYFIQIRHTDAFPPTGTLLVFYKSCIQSVLTFSFICWFGNVSQKDKNSLQRIVNISSKVTGVTQSTLTALYEKQVVNKATRILADDKHVLHADYILLPSSRRFRTVTCKTNRKRFSFVPMSIRLLNDKSLGHYF